MSEHTFPPAADFAFVDPITGKECVLHLTPSEPLWSAAGVAHDGCGVLADVAIDLDAFYCTACQWNGRVTGAWVLDLWDSMQPAVKAPGGSDG